MSGHSHPLWPSLWVLAGKRGRGSCFLSFDTPWGILLQAGLACFLAKARPFIFLVLSELFSSFPRLLAPGRSPHCLVQLYLCQEAPRELHPQAGGHGSDPPCAWGSRQYWGHAGVGRWGRPGKDPSPRGKREQGKEPVGLLVGPKMENEDFVERWVHLCCLGWHVPPQNMMKLPEERLQGRFEVPVLTLESQVRSCWEPRIRGNWRD